VLAALGERLAKFKTPKRVFLVDSLPRNTMGKVQKATLRETYKGVYVVPTAPRDTPAEPAGPDVGSIDRARS
jgi:acyl-CoA synthetase (AMP-forming)/AMP-acid ligase II